MIQTFVIIKEIFQITAMTAFTSSVALCSLNTVTFVTSVGAMVGGFSEMYFNFKLTSTGVIMYPRERAYNSPVTLTAINGTSLKCIQYLNPTSVLSLPTNITNLVDSYESTRFFSCNNNYFIGPRYSNGAETYYSNGVEMLFEKFSVTSGEDLGSFQLSNNDLFLETCDGQDFYSSSSNDIFKNSTGLRYHTTSILSLS